MAQGIPMRRSTNGKGIKVTPSTKGGIAVSITTGLGAPFIEVSSGGIPVVFVSGTGPADTTAPTITSANPSGTYAEMVAISGTLTADEAVTWSKSGADAALVTLNGATGAWSIPTTDYETKTSYSWTFTATDGAGNQTPQNVAITISDIDEIPDAFTFTDVTGATVSTQYTSNTITVAGLGSGVSVPVTVSGGTYSKNGGAYTSAAGTAQNGDTFAVRQTSSASNSTATNTALTIGGVSDTYTTTTIAGDVTAPTLSSPTDAANGSTGATISVSTNEANGTLYWYISTSAAPPTAANLKAGTGAVVAGSQTVSSTGVQNASPTGLTASTTYYAHFLHRDAAGNDSAIASGDGFTTTSGVATDTLIAWTPSMLNLSALYTVEDQATFKDTGGSTATAGTAVETWQDKTANARHAVSAANSAGASTSSTRPVVGTSETLGSWTGSPIRFGNGVRTHRLITPASTYGMASGAEGDKLFTIYRTRDGGTAAQRTILGSSAGSFTYHLDTSDSTGAGKLLTGSTAGLIKTDTTTRIDMVVQQKDITTSNSWVARLNGTEIASATGTGSSVASTGRLTIGNVYNGSSGADADLFVVAVIPAGTSRANIQRLEGYYAALFGLTLATGHPYASAAPMVPTGTTSTQSWVDVNYATASAQQTWLGPMCELQSDSFDSSLTTTPIENQTDQWGFPQSLTSGEQARLKSEWFPGDGTGYMFIRFALGNNCYRGFRNIDGTSGLAKNIGERYSGQNSALNTLLANIGPAGGGIVPEYWSPAPHWKQSSSYSNLGGSGHEGLWAGAGYARTVLLDSIKGTDLTQYNAQIDLIASAMVDDLEYLHANIAPVRGFSLQNEPFNPADAAYGHCLYTATMYADLLAAVVTKIAASTALATWGGVANSVPLYGASWQASNTQAVFAAHSLHYITSLSADADYAKSNMASWGTSVSNKPIMDNEFEYFTDPANDPWQFTNTALCQAHFVHLGRAPMHNPMIHILKQLGQTGSAGNTKGYAVLKARLPYPFNEHPTDPGDENPTLDHGYYQAQGLNANAVKLFSDNLKAGSKVQPHSYSQAVAGTQMVGFKTAAGKAGAVFVNRTASAVALSLGLSGTRDVKVLQYDKDNAATLIDRRITSAVSVSVPAYSAYVVVEQ